VPSIERRRGDDRGAEGAEGMGFLGRIVPLPSRLGDLGERRELPQAEPRPPTHSGHISAPQKPSSRRLLKFGGPEICL